MTDLVPPPHLSPSSIGTFQQCPLKFKYSKIDKLFDPPSDASIMGNFVHDVLEDLYGLPSQERTLDSARNLMRQQWTSKWGEEASTVVHQKDLHDFRWKAWWCVENYFDMENPQEIQPTGLETKVEGNIGGQKVLGFIDRWTEKNNTVTISDYKTGKVPAARYRNGKFFQLLVYSYLIGQMFPDYEVETLELLYIKGGVRLTEKVTASNRDKMIATVSEVSEGINIRCKSGDFEYKTSKLCDWCGYKSFCPAWQ